MQLFNVDRIFCKLIRIDPQHYRSSQPISCRVGMVCYGDSMITVLLNFCVLQVSLLAVALSIFLLKNPALTEMELSINHHKVDSGSSLKVHELIPLDDGTKNIVASARLSDGKNALTSESSYELSFDNVDKLKNGFMQYGCLHYRRRCRIRAPCCNEIFDCRHCHNEAKDFSKVNGKDRHDLPRHELQRVICSLCGTEQEVRQVCINCGVCMGRYFCGTCKLFDDDTCKEQYHCNGCGICRIGGRENFFHCYTCGCCYSNILKNSHPCVEGSMCHNCPVCFEYLFESRNDVSVLPCGHTIHMNCLKEMQQHLQYACPLCSKSVCDMSKVWKQMDNEVAATAIPGFYHNKKVCILCNDCGESSEVQYHVVGQKCLNCKSYNTRQT